MATTGCPNSKCEYFNRRLPDNLKYCPLCGTPLGNVVPPKPSEPISKPQANPPQPVQTPQPVQPPQNYQPPQPVQPPQNYQPPQPVQPPQNYQPSVNPSTQYQIRPPAVQQYKQPSQNIPTLKLIHTSGKEFYFSGEEGLIGRRSANEPNFIPEIDLSVIPHQGVISRRHARVYWDWSQNSYMIVDMSTNGIYLSNNLLNPGIPYRLISGVPMQLGQDALVNFTVTYV